MRSSRTSLLMAAAFGAASFFGAAGHSGQLIEKAAIRPQQPRGNTLRAILGGGLGAPAQTGSRTGPSWSNRQVQRMAAKRRNQARHRAACRGRNRSRA